MSKEKKPKKKNNKINSAVFIILLAFVSLGIGGALGYFTYVAEDTNQNAQNVLIHVYDGEVEYFNGSAWVPIGSLSLAENDDPFLGNNEGTKTDNPVIRSLRANGVTPVKVTYTYRPSTSSSGSSSGTVPSSPSGGDGEDITVGD